jgi:hypothetical protein
VFPPTFRITPRVTDWIASGFLEDQSAARKNRSYRLEERYCGLAA